MKRVGMLELLLAVSVPLAVAVFSGCGEDDDDSSADTTTFEATFAGPGNDSGRLSVTINAALAGTVLSVREATGSQTVGAQTVGASGRLVFVNGQTVPLTGTYDSAADDVDLAGGGYRFAGFGRMELSGGDKNGTYTGPNGGGYVVGLPGAAGVYCGTFTGTRDVSPRNVSGKFNMVIGAGGKITGLGVDDMNKGSVLSGTLSGNSISARTTSGTTITGILNGNNVSGSFSERQSRGTWSGTRL